MVQLTNGDDPATQPPVESGHEKSAFYDSRYEEHEWEDIPEEELNLANPRERSPPSLSSTKVRKRKSGQKAVFVAQPTPSRKASSKSRSPKDTTAPLVDREQVNQAVTDGAVFTIRYLRKIIVNAVKWLQYPFTLLLFLWIIAFMMNQFANVFHTVFTPICYLPGTSKLPLCYTGPRKMPKWADYPKLMDVQSSTFDQLLDDTIGGSTLSLEVKKAEMATSDLVTLVKVSELKSRDSLARTLEDFVADAKKTGRGLQKLSSKVAGAVDSIVAVNDYALHAIEQRQHKSPSALSILWPFSTGLATQEVVLATFTDAMSVVSQQMNRVVLEAEASLANLVRLEERLQTLHDILTRENASISAEKSELLAELWTMLGGNKRRIKGLDKHFFLLRSIGEYRTRAQAHVVAALQSLQGMSEDMEDLRERVAAPEIVGERIPVEVHIKSIKAGLDRLANKRIKAQEREEEAVRRILGVEDE